jgi:hypothetical protein
VNSATKTQPPTVLILWTLIVIYAAARVFQVFPGKIPLLAIVALHVLPAMAFAVISIFAMSPITLLAWARIRDAKTQSSHS